MPVCPSCGSELEAGRCPACSAPPGGEPAGSERWMRVYTGPGRVVDMVETTLRLSGISVVRLPGERAEVFPNANAHGTEHLAIHTLAVPAEQYDARWPQIDAAIMAAGGGDPEPDTDAMAEAEEDYDVRACPRCVLYLHETYSECPGCGTELVPAVECFVAGQLEPDRVIVSHGTVEAAKALADELRQAGFNAEAFEVEDWPVAVVDLPWRELTERTAEAERLFRAGTAG